MYIFWCHDLKELREFKTKRELKNHLILVNGFVNKMINSLEKNSNFTFPHFSVLRVEKSIENMKEEEIAFLLSHTKQGSILRLKKDFEDKINHIFH